MKTLILIVTAALFIGCNQQKPDAKESLKTPDADEIAILATINTVYDNIHVDSLNQPDFALIKKQFTDSAKMGLVKNDSLIWMSPEDYFNKMKGSLVSNNVRYLKEWEIQGQTHYFGTVAQRTSLYGVHFNRADTIAEKGIINYQLIKVNNEWKILSMIWQAERNGNSVPDNYFD